MVIGLAKIINRCKDGSLITTNVNISAVRDVNQVVKNYLMLFTDITAQKRMQDEIQRQVASRWLDRLAQSSPVYGAPGCDAKPVSSQWAASVRSLSRLGRIQAN